MGHLPQSEKRYTVRAWVDFSSSNGLLVAAALSAVCTSII